MEFPDSHEKIEEESGSNLAKRHNESKAHLTYFEP
jgi:hypothetical protein